MAIWCDGVEVPPVAFFQLMDEESQQKVMRRAVAESIPEGRQAWVETMSGAEVRALWLDLSEAQRVAAVERFVSGGD